MGVKHFCDLCKKILDFKERINISSFESVKNGDYCLKCWKNEKKWKKIHEIKNEKPQNHRPLPGKK